MLKNDNKCDVANLRILGVSGSMREGSRSARLAMMVLEAAREHGAQIRLLDLNEIDLPMFRTGAFYGEHSGRDTANDAVNWAQAFVLVTPDYHGSMSGAMKNFLDHYWREFAGKLFAVACVSNEKGLTVIDQMCTAIRQCYGWSLPYGLSATGSDFNEFGALQNENCIARTAMMARDVAVYGSLIHAQFLHDLESDELRTFAARYRR
jgi:FMN reductase